MPDLVKYSPLTDETKIVAVAREIAIDLNDLETILKRHQITPEAFAKIKETERFKSVLATELVAWHGAANTHERAKLKAASMIEEWLPEAWARLHKNEEALPAKVELAKLITKIAEMGAATPVGPGSGERFSITINLGAGRQIQIEKDVPAMKTIEGEVVSTQEA